MNDLYLSLSMHCYRQAKFTQEVHASVSNKSFSIFLQKCVFSNKRTWKRDGTI